MIKIIPAASRHHEDIGWLKTYWLFSFAEYYDPQNTRFGALRVFNDDTIMPGHGFPFHPHREMEIVTIPLAGAASHEDSLGNLGEIRAGEVQRMTAGRGLAHSEFNHAHEPLHLYQIWIAPSKAGLEPGYEQARLEPEAWHNKLYPVASGVKGEGAVFLHADATICRGELDAKKTVYHASRPGRKIFIYLASGKALVNMVAMNEGDQARCEGEAALEIIAKQRCELILIDSNGAADEQPNAKKAMAARQFVDEQEVSPVGGLPDFKKCPELTEWGVGVDAYLEAMGEDRPGESWSDCAERVRESNPALAGWLRRFEAGWDEAMQARPQKKQSAGVSGRRP